MTRPFVSPDTEMRIKEGLAFEKKIFGFSSDSDNFKKNNRGKRKIKFRAGVTAVMQMQKKLPWNPKKPATEQAKKLVEVVEANLPPEFKDKVLLYCAIGTRLDLIGVDGFFIIEGNPQYPVTFDLVRTACAWKNKKKGWQLKANGYISVADMSCKERVSKIGAAIALGLLMAIHKKKSTRKRLWN